MSTPKAEEKQGIELRDCPSCGGSKTYEVVITRAQDSRKCSKCGFYMGGLIKELE